MLRDASGRPAPSVLAAQESGAFWSARVGLRIRALARDRPEGLVWFWIGDLIPYHSPSAWFRIQVGHQEPRLVRRSPRPSRTRYTISTTCGVSNSRSFWASVSPIMLAQEADPLIGEEPGHIVVREPFVPTGSFLPVVHRGHRPIPGGPPFLKIASQDLDRGSAGFRRRASMTARAAPPNAPTRYTGRGSGAAIARYASSTSPGYLP